ncbi:MAG: hypothetical protein ABSA86_00860 [Oryzomonas sp.]|jgi:hypothetical protein
MAHVRFSPRIILRNAIVAPTGRISNNHSGPENIVSFNWLIERNVNKVRNCSADKPQLALRGMVENPERLFYLGYPLETAKK